jgi:hypothetical protein
MFTPVSLGGRKARNGLRDRVEGEHRGETADPAAFGKGAIGAKGGDATGDIDAAAGEDDADRVGRGLAGTR